MKIPTSLKLLAFMLLYVILGRLGISVISLPPGNLTLLWLPSGIGAIMICLYGTRALPWVIAASWLVNYKFYWTGSEGYVHWFYFFTGSTVSCLTDALQSWLVWKLWQGYFPSEWRWDYQHTLKFLIRGVLLPSLLTTWLLALMPYLKIIIPGMKIEFIPGDYIKTYLNLFAGDALGIMVMVPFLSSFFSGRELLKLNWLKYMWPASLMLVPLLAELINQSVGYLIPIFFIPVIARARFTGAAHSLAALTVSLLILTVMGAGPFHGKEIGMSISHFTMLICGIGSLFLMMGAVLEEHYHYEKHLEQKVITRTRELQNALGQVQSLSTLDSLTGAYNRNWYDQNISSEIARCVREKIPISIILLDVDSLKSINAEKGISAGDSALREAAEVIRTRLRASDILLRWSSEEFLVITPGCSLKDAYALAEKMRVHLKANVYSQIKTVTVSVGVAEYCENENAQHWLSRADSAMNTSKLNGRDRVTEAAPAGSHV